jgi:Tfp pilus assembly pilus retraction ATPase PilT
MQVGQSESGMVTMNQCLLKLVQDGVITEETALGCTTVPDEMLRLITSMSPSRPRAPGK